MCHRGLCLALPAGRRPSSLAQRSLVFVHAALYWGEPPVTVVVLVRACQDDMSFGPVEMFADDVADLVIGDGTGPEVVGRRPLTPGMLDSGDTPRA